MNQVFLNILRNKLNSIPYFKYDIDEKVVNIDFRLTMIRNKRKFILNECAKASLKGTI